MKDQIKHLCSAANSVTSPKSPEVEMNFYVKYFLPQLKSNIFCNISKERPGSHSPQSLQLPLSRMINPENTDWDVCAGLSILFIRIGILCQRDKPIITPWVEDHLPITVEGQIQLPASNPKNLWRKLWSGFYLDLRRGVAFPDGFQEKIKIKSRFQCVLTCWVHMTCWG